MGVIGGSGMIQVMRIGPTKVIAGTDAAGKEADANDAI
jgi:hypothetical protein